MLLGERYDLRAQPDVFGVRERWGLVWLAPAEPRTELFADADVEDAAYVGAWLPPARTPAPAGVVADNFLDVAHFPFVHAGDVRRRRARRSCRPYDVTARAGRLPQRAGAVVRQPARTPASPPGCGRCASAAGPRTSTGRRSSCCCGWRSWTPARSRRSCSSLQPEDADSTRDLHQDAAARHRRRRRPAADVVAAEVAFEERGARRGPRAAARRCDQPGPAAAPARRAARARRPPAASPCAGSLADFVDGATARVMDLLLRNARLLGPTASSTSASTAAGSSSPAGAGRRRDAIDLGGPAGHPAAGRAAHPPGRRAHRRAAAAQRQSGSLFEGIAIWAERVADLTVEDVKQRVREVLRWQLANGVQYVRSHVDVCDPELTRAAGAGRAARGGRRPDRPAARRVPAAGHPRLRRRRGS